MKNLGKALKAVRKEQGMSLRDAAAEIGTTHNTLSRLEKGLPCDARTLAAVLTWLFK